MMALEATPSPRMELPPTALAISSITLVSLGPEMKSHDSEYCGMLEASCGLYEPEGMENGP